MRTWDLWLVIIVYTITFFWFGEWVQKKSDQRQLKQWMEEAWTKGYRECAQFEIDTCMRDQLRGVRKEPEKIKP